MGKRANEKRQIGVSSENEGEKAGGYGLLCNGDSAQVLPAFVKPSRIGCPQFTHLVATLMEQELRCGQEEGPGNFCVILL